MGKILLVGEDFLLLATRAAVLATTGSDVVPCNPCELSIHLGTEKFDLVVLCHTLRDEARRGVVADARRRWPDVRILQVAKTSGQMSASECGADDATTAEPGALIDHATRLLSYDCPKMKPSQRISSPCGSSPAELRSNQPSTL